MLPTLSVATRHAGRAVVAVAFVVTAVTACAPANSTPGSGSTSAASGAAATCAKNGLALHSAGKLTIGTDDPVYEPWFVDNKPSNGKGFESAVAYAVARQLGFAAGDVVWTKASFNSAIAPGPKTYDFDINEVSITPERRKAVDFSSGYYDVTQALLTVKGSKIANAKSLADLRGARLGAQVGTTSYSTITTVIKPTTAPAVFNTNDDAKLALQNGQIDGLVLDLPTALYEASGADSGLKNPVLVGQFAGGAGTPEQFGLVLDLGSPLTTCVSRAVDALRADGTLKQLEQTWLTASAGAPVLERPGTWHPSPRERERAAFRRRRSARSLLIAASSTAVVVVVLVAGLTSSPGWPRVRESFLSWDAARQSLPDVAVGLWLNVRVFVVVAVAMLLIGLGIAVLRTLPGPVFWPVRALATGYVDVFRGSPLLVLLFLVGFGVPGLRLQGVPGSATVLGGVALTLSYSGYVAEVFRAGIESVHPSQRAAARSLGLTSGQTLRLVVLPQAVRRVVPPLLNDLASLIKDCGLISVLGIPLDAIRWAQIWQAQLANYTPYVVAGVLFMLITIPMTRFTDAVSRRYGFVPGGGHL